MIFPFAWRPEICDIRDGATSALFVHVARVDGLSSKAQMRRIYATRVVARVHNDVAVMQMRVFSYWSVMNLVRNPVSKFFGGHAALPD